MPNHHVMLLPSTTWIVTGRLLSPKGRYAQTLRFRTSCPHRAVGAPALYSDGWPGGNSGGNTLPRPGLASYAFSQASRVKLLVNTPKVYVSAYVVLSVKTTNGETSVAPSAKVIGALISGCPSPRHVTR